MLRRHCPEHEPRVVVIDYGNCVAIECPCGVCSPSIPVRADAEGARNKVIGAWHAALARDDEQAQQESRRVQP